MSKFDLKQLNNLPDDIIIQILSKADGDSVRELCVQSERIGQICNSGKFAFAVLSNEYPGALDIIKNSTVPQIETDEGLIDAISTFLNSMRYIEDKFPQNDGKNYGIDIITALYLESKGKPISESTILAILDADPDRSFYNLNKIVDDNIAFLLHDYRANRKLPLSPATVDKLVSYDIQNDQYYELQTSKWNYNYPIDKKLLIRVVKGVPNIIHRGHDGVHSILFDWVLEELKRKYDEGSINYMLMMDIPEPLNIENDYIRQYIIDNTEYVKYMDLMNTLNSLRDDRNAYGRMWYNLGYYDQSVLTEFMRHHV